jgi:Leu/Phe-tRNA-protein transferase
MKKILTLSLEQRIQVSEDILFTCQQLEQHTAALGSSEALELIRGSS